MDLDWLCFGDRLYNIALTRMALLDAGESPDYADYLAQEENVAGFRSRALDFYTLVFCVDFIGGAGMQFNRETTPAVSEGRKSELIEQFWILAAKFGLRR